MADSELLLSILLVLITFIIYGLKWAVLIAVTLFLLKFTIDAYSDFQPRSNSHGNENLTKNKPNRSGDQSDDYHINSNDSFYATNSDSLNECYAGMESNGYGTRAVRNVVRRNPMLTQDLPYNNLPKYTSQSKRHSTGLKSPEPLLSQVTRHLSFNNTSYYLPEKTKLSLSLNDSMTMLNTSRPTSSQMSPKWYSPMDTTLPLQRHSLDKTSSLLEERYSPMQFTVNNPQKSAPLNTSTVKISRPGDGENDSRFALESILHQRLERTKDNPCSRQSVLSALGQKSRKRAAYDCDSSLVESYSVKKRRRDELDDFLDSVNNPSSSPTVPYTGIKSMKRSYHESRPKKPALEITRKRIKEKRTRLGSESSPTLNSPSSASEDSGLDLNSPNNASQENESSTLNSQAKVVQPAKRLTKRKSVTFSDKLVDGPSAEQTSVKKTQKPADGRTAADINNENTDSQENRVDYSQVFHTGFSPRKSLTPEYLSSISNPREKKKLRRRLNITWKDLQENRREAWRRSQKLLDEIEESFSKELGSTISPEVTSLPTSTVTSLATSTVTSFPTSLPTSKIPATSQQTTNTTNQVQPQRKIVGQFTNFIGRLPIDHPLANLGASTRVTASNTLSTHTDRKTPTVAQSGISSGSTGTTGGSAFAVPKSSSTSSPLTGLFGGTSSKPAAPLLLSGSTSGNTNATGQQSSFSFQAPLTSSSSASQPTTSTVPKFGVQASALSSTAQAVSQTSTAHTPQNTTAGLFNFNSGSGTSTVGSSVQATTTTLTQPKPEGFSFSASAVTKANPNNSFAFSSPAVTTPNISGGFTLTTQAEAGEKSTALGGFTFAAPTTEKPTTSSSFTFTAPATEKPKTSGGFAFTAPAHSKPNTSGGFAFTAPPNDKPNTSGGFAFTAPTNDKPNTSGGFAFTAPANDKPNTSGGFAFTAPTNDKPNTSGGFAFTAPTNDKTNTRGGFAFTAPANDKPNTSGGFKFTAPAANKPNASGGFQFNPNGPAVNGINNSIGGFASNANPPSNSGGFNFGSQSTPSAFSFGSPGGFNFAGSSGFASSTPIPTNTGSTGATVAKARQRRQRQRR